MAAPGLPADIIAARRALVSRFEDFDQHVDCGRAWGFSLDPRNSRGQVGIYGTVAAVEVLTMAGHATDSPLVAGGLRALRDFFPDTNRRWHQKHDLDTTLKRAWMARIDALDEVAVEHRNWLVDTQLDGLGWGGYTGADYQSDSPDFVSSCYALIGLVKHTSYHGDPQAAAAVRWILREVADISRQHVGDLALAIIAITAFVHTDVDVQKEIEQFISRASPRLRTYVKRRRPEVVPAFRDYFHFIGKPPDARREPFQIPVELAVLKALLSTGDADNIRACRSAMRRLTKSIIEDGGVNVDGLFRTETQLWAASVLFGLPARVKKILSNCWFPWRDRRFIWTSVATLGVLALMVLDELIEETADDATGPKAIARDALAVASSPLAVIFELLLIALIAIWKVRE